MQKANTADVLLRLLPVIQCAPHLSFTDCLLAAGWIQVDPDRSGDHSEWRSGDLIGKRYVLEQASCLEVELEVHFPEVDGEDEKALIELFMQKFAESAARAREVLGNERFMGPYGSRGFPADIDAMMIAEWGDDLAKLLLCLKYEGLDVPIRITAIAAK